MTLVCAAVCLVLAGCRSSSSSSQNKAHGNPLNTSLVYAGRLSLTLPAHAAIQIDGADYDGVEIAVVPNADAANLNTAWKERVEQIDTYFGPNKRVVLNKDLLEATPAVLYRVLPGDTLAGEDKVIREVWTVVSGRVVSLKAQGFRREQPLLASLLSKVLHALSPMSGPVGPDVFVAPGCYVHLPPPAGESVSATVHFDPGYDLMVSTEVFNHPHPPDPQQRLRSGAASIGVSHGLLSGPARAGSLSGSQAVVRLAVEKTNLFLAEYGYGGVDGGDPLQPTTSLRLSADDRNGALNENAFLNTWHAVLAGLSVRGYRTGNRGPSQRDDGR